MFTHVLTYDALSIHMLFKLFHAGDGGKDQQKHTLSVHRPIRRGYALEKMHCLKFFVSVCTSSYIRLLYPVLQSSYFTLSVRL